VASSTTSVITRARRINLAKITRGAVETIPRIAYIAFGDGGVDEDGQPIQPDESWQALGHEVARYELDSVTNPIETTNRYTVTIQENELNGVSVSEMALIDEEGVFAAVKTFLPKGKDADVKFVFEFDDEF
jgi:phage-related tail fiber protein